MIYNDLGLKSLDFSIPTFFIFQRRLWDFKIRGTSLKSGGGSTYFVHNISTKPKLGALSQCHIVIHTMTYGPLKNGLRSQNIDGITNHNYYVISSCSSLVQEQTAMGMRPNSALLSGMCSHLGGRSFLWSVRMSQMIAGIVPSVHSILDVYVSVYHAFYLSSISVNI